MRVSGPEPTLLGQCHSVLLTATGTMFLFLRHLVRLPGTSLTGQKSPPWLWELWVLLPTRFAGDKGIALLFSNVQVYALLHLESGQEKGCRNLLRDVLDLWFSFFLLSFWLPLFPTSSFLPSQGIFLSTLGRGRELLDRKTVSYHTFSASLGWLGSSPGEGTGNPLQYSCVENPMDIAAWRSTDHGVAKS